MATLGTYSSGYKPWTPFYAIPENGDAITWDWMNSLSQFSQRFKKIATTIATMNWHGTTTFDYSALGCDYFPPILKAYYHAGGGTWKQFDFATTYINPGGTTSPQNAVGSYARDKVQFRNIGLQDCIFVNEVANNVTVWQLIAYM